MDEWGVVDGVGGHGGGRRSTVEDGGRVDKIMDGGVWRGLAI